MLERVTIKKGKKYGTFYVRIPSGIAKSLKIKRNDVLMLVVDTVKVDSKERLGLIYYKP